MLITFSDSITKKIFKMENKRVNIKRHLALYAFLVSQSICLTDARNVGPQVDPGKNSEFTSSTINC